MNSTLMQSQATRRSPVRIWRRPTSAILLLWGSLFGTVLGAALGDATAAEQFALRENEVVVFLGGTNTVQMQRAGYLETILTQAFASKQPKFRDLSWEADTIHRLGTVVERWRPDGFGDWAEQLRRVGATTVVMQFGQLEAISSEANIERFTAAYRELIQNLPATVRQIVIITPFTFDPPTNAFVPDLTRHNILVEQLTVALNRLGIENDAHVVDLSRLHQELKVERLTSNGMHIMPELHSLLAREIASQLGVTVDMNSPLFSNTRQAVQEKHRLWYDYWRPANWKLLYGDDAKRVFTRGGEASVPFREEWQQLVPLIETAERRVSLVAAGKVDPGAQRPKPEVLHGAPEASIEAELQAFNVAAGLEVSLFASEVHGVTSPLAVRWDTQGRMYVTISTTYPHVFPGDIPNDKVIVLEDRDHDGKADRSTVFAEGLNIPTGIELGDGGVYIGQNTELLFIKDTDGDLRADSREIVLSGFGNGDSHQTINSFVWSPGGELYMGQGDGCESRVETPWGSRDLYQAGFYRFRPRRLQLDPLLDDFMGPGNPWGVAFNAWGQIFCIDGAGGVSFLSPGQIPTNHRLRLKTIGKPGGYCGIGYLEGSQLPTHYSDSFAIGDYKSNRIKCFRVVPDGGGYDVEWQEPLLTSSHRNFRPVDVRVGPDGAVYVVDWYNPITCHQDDRYRDPTRDKAHGRIWRIAKKDGNTVPFNFASANTETLTARLASTSYYDRYQAKRALVERSFDTKQQTETAAALVAWAEQLDPHLEQYEHRLYSAITALETIEHVERPLLARLLAAEDPRARAYAARLVGRWHDRLDDPLELLRLRVADVDPLVRMEAVLACAAIPSVQSIECAAHVIDSTMDPWIEYAFKQAVHHLAPLWRPAIKEGSLEFASSEHLAAVLNELGGQEMVAELAQLVRQGTIRQDSRTAALRVILAMGNTDDIEEFAMSRKLYRRNGVYERSAHLAALQVLLETLVDRESVDSSLQPTKEMVDALGQLLQDDDVAIRMVAQSLAGSWQLAVYDTLLRSVVDSETATVKEQLNALQAVAKLDSVDYLRQLVRSTRPIAMRSTALAAIARRDPSVAAKLAPKMLTELAAERETNADALAATLLRAFVETPEGDRRLRDTLAAQPLDAAVARNTLRAFFATGRTSKLLCDMLTHQIGTSSKPREFSKAYVNRLATIASTAGDAKNGAAVFRNLACSTCHRIGDAPTGVGPDLTAIGNTLSPARIIEEILWPNRNVKEGYSVLQIESTDGRVHQGFRRRLREADAAGNVCIQDLTTGELMSFPAEEIEEQHTAGSPMPDGITAVLTESQLVDLIRFVTELGAAK